MNADHSRRTFLLGGLATGAVLLAGKTFLHPSAAHAATEAVTLDVCVNMTPEEMAERSQYVRPRGNTFRTPPRKSATPACAPPYWTS